MAAILKFIEQASYLFSLINYCGYSCDSLCCQEVQRRDVESIPTNENV